MFTPNGWPLDALNQPIPQLDRSGRESFGRRYVLNTERCPGPPIHDALRSPRHTMPSMVTVLMWSLSGGMVPGRSAAGAARHPVDIQCRRSALWGSYTSEPVPSSASDTSIVLERPFLTSACRTLLPYQNIPSVG